MEKKYIDFIKDITKDELYKGLLAEGLFTEKLPPFLSSIKFFEYCKKNSLSCKNKEKPYIYYESMRNTNVPRPLAIPNPIVYQKLCEKLYEDWDKIQNMFIDTTGNQDYKVSRIHIRKVRDSDKLFKMNYTDWKKDGNPELNLLIGRQYKVKADISNCFPSIYTHSLSWALVGKQLGKQERTTGWNNELDKCVRYMKNGETQGLLIGPHSSNLLSEIILCKIDSNLSKWRYVRNIDDYTCYVKSHDEAQRFLNELRDELREFGLVLNHKKTEIIELPVISGEKWINKLNLISILEKKDKLDYKGVQIYLDWAIELMKKHKMNTAILSYAFKVLGNKILTQNAKKYCIKMFFHLTLIYPYLVLILEDSIFKKFEVKNADILVLSQELFNKGLEEKNYEIISYAVYYAIKYEFDIEELNVEDIIRCNDCICKVISYIYFKKNGKDKELQELVNHAKELVVDEDEFNKNWLFVYEALTMRDFDNKFKDSFKNDWKAMKKGNVSFIKEEILNNNLKESMKNVIKIKEIDELSIVEAKTK
ncbi:RNA-directed DNA polymerase [uncultured Clostridium sp.]|jgi:hypothetical protein|uniref:RNA-directed DNA polymerase n=1 Tax=uncultured Clostridium sp. TaxID=59620 RepID=UPI0026327628|nr:RNA-directed DNA polymerase [uncultured Clostridium sp.]